MKKFVFGFITVALVIAQAASAVTVHLTAPMTAAGTTLKAGEYKVQIDSNNSVTFQSEGKTITVPATTQKGGGKFHLTMMESEGSTLKAIHVGGTDTTILFSPATASAGGN